MNAILRPRFHVVAIYAIAALVVVGFSRTFFLKYWFETPALTKLLHLHGAVFTAWLLLLFWRTRPADMTDRFYVHLVIFAALVQMPYYGLVPAQIQIIMLLAGAVLRPEVSATVIPTRRAAREAVLV